MSRRRRSSLFDYRWHCLAAQLAFVAIALGLSLGALD